jgi:hypothetical protein
MAGAVRHAGSFNTNNAPSPQLQLHLQPAETTEAKGHLFETHVQHQINLADINKMSIFGKSASDKSSKKPVVHEDVNVSMPMRGNIEEESADFEPGDSDSRTPLISKWQIENTDLQASSTLLLTRHVHATPHKFRF